MIALGLLPPYRLGVASDPAWMRTFAQHAEAAGFESLLAVDHVAVPVGYESRYPYSDTGRMPLPEDCELPDPLDLLVWLAGQTERLRLGTGILVLPEHHPLALAKRCATIDRLSGGRLFLGVGVGWMREEVAALGIDPDERASRTDEAILRRLPLGVEFDSLRKTLPGRLEFEVGFIPQPLVGQGHHGVEVPRPCVSRPGARVVRTDRDRQFEEPHGLDRIGVVESRTRLR